MQESNERFIKRMWIKLQANYKSKHSMAQFKILPAYNLIAQRSYCSV